MALFGGKKKKDNNNNNNNSQTRSSPSPEVKGSKGIGNELKTSTGSEGAYKLKTTDQVDLNASTSVNTPSFQTALLPQRQEFKASPASSTQQNSFILQNQNVPSSSSVLYPWSLRPLNVLPSSKLPSPNDFFAGNAGHRPLSPIWGPLSAPPFPRYGHSVNSIASSPTGDLYIFGGLVSNTVKNDLYVMGCTPALGMSSAEANGSNNNNNNNSLEVGIVETRGQIPGPRVGHSSVGVGNVLIVWGGDTKSRPEDRQDDGLYLLNLSSREWTRVTTTGPVPEGRYGHASAMVGSKFFVFGGQNDDGGFMNDLVWFDLQKLKLGQPRWTFVEYSPSAIRPPKRTGHTLVTHGDCLYVFGGTDGQYHYNDTWCYDTNTQIWEELSCIGYIPVPREGHAATLVDDVMYVFGGRGVDGKDLEDLAAFKITNQRWFMFQNMGPAPSGRSGHAMATWQKKVYVLGGESYTSQKPDNPSLIHVLDTEKIKYPIENSPQYPSLGARKSSVQLSDQTAHDSSIPLTISPSNTSFDVGPLLQSRDPSKETQVDGNSRPILNSVHDNLLAEEKDSIEFETPPPNRPARPGDEYSLPTKSTLTGLEQEGIYLNTTPEHVVATTSGNVFDSQSDMEVLKARDIWMRVALAAAVNKGFVKVDEEKTRFLNATPIVNLEGAAAKDVVSDLIRMKQDLAKAKMILSEQAHSVDERIAGASRARIAALQEASYYRVKLAALETGTSDDIGKLDRDHSQLLESKLAESISARTHLEQRLVKLEEERDHLFTNSSSAQELKDSAINRANTAEISASRSLNDYADLQRRYDRQNSAIQSHVQQIASLTSTSQQLSAENEHLSHRVARSEVTQAESLQTLEQTRLTLVAANTRNNEILSIWEDNQSTSTQHQSRAEALAVELESQKSFNRSTLAKVADLERILKATRDEHEATKLLAAGALAEFVTSHKGRQGASNQVLQGVQADKLKAVSIEAETLRHLHQDATSKLESLFNELDEARARESESQTQIAQLRVELTKLQNQTNEEADRNRTNVDHQGELLGATKAREIAEVKANLLRNFLFDHGLTANEETSSDNTRDVEGSKSIKMMQLKIDSLEQQLNQQLQSERSPITQESVQAEDLRSVVLEQKLKESEDQLTVLAREVSQLRSSEDVKQSERSKKVEEELESLSTKHRHLEQTHMKAVQYVKGTEKMLRRMKEEVTRYKERNEELENEQQDAPITSDTIELKAELKTLSRQIDQLSTSSSQATTKNEHLLQQLALVETQYGKQLHDIEVDATLRVDELQNELARLDLALDKTNREFSESINLNKRLESELSTLQTNLKKDTTLKQTTLTQDEITHLEQNLRLRQEQTDLLQLENDQLEQRCRTAEEKISVLLDHFEHFNEEENSREEIDGDENTRHLSNLVEHHD